MMQNKILICMIFISITLFMGCTRATFMAIERQGGLEEKIVSKDIFSILNQTNPRLLDKVLDNLTLPEKLYSLIGRNDRILIQSLERNYYSDNDLQLVINRGLISKFLNRNIPVLERDENILITALVENNENLGRDWKAYSFKAIDTQFVFENKNPLQTATKVFAYRVLEFGIINIPINQGNFIQRVGFLELEIRLIDVKSSQILFIDLVKSNYVDRISNEDYKIVNDLHYKFISDALPLVQSVQPKDFILTNMEQSFYEGTGYYKLRFRRGDVESQVRIIYESTNTEVASFVVPTLNENSSFFDYELKIDPISGKFKKGTYVIYIDGNLVYKFDI